jgi:hypothetical protein
MKAAKMSMNPIPRKINDEDQSLIDEYLKKGGVVSVGKSSQRSEEINYKNGPRRGKKKE